MMRILCWFGIHRWYWQFVGSSWQPNDYVKVCEWCDREWPGVWLHDNAKDQRVWE